QPSPGPLPPPPPPPPSPYTPLFRSPTTHTTSGAMAILLPSGSFEHLLQFVPAQAHRHRPAMGAVSDLAGLHLFRQSRQLRRLVLDRKSTRLNSSHGSLSYAVICSTS